MASFGDSFLRLFKKMAKQGDQRDNAGPAPQLDGSNEARIKQQAERERASAAAEVEVKDSEFVAESLPATNRACLQGNFGNSSAARELRKKVAAEFKNTIYDADDAEPGIVKEAERAISFNNVISHRHLDDMEDFSASVRHEEIESPLDEPGNASLFAGKLLNEEVKVESATKWSAPSSDQLAPGKAVNPTEESFKQVAACPTTSPSTLTWLSTQPSAEIRAAVASNHHVPQDTLRKLASDSDSTVRMAVASNKRTADDILRQLSHDDNKLVAGEAFSSLALREKANAQANGPAFNKFAPPKVNPVQTKVPIIGSSTSTKLPSIPGPSALTTQSQPAVRASESPPASVSPPAPSRSAPSSSPTPTSSPAPSSPPLPSSSPVPSSSPTPSSSPAPATVKAPEPAPSVPAPNFTKTNSLPSPIKSAPIVPAAKAPTPVAPVDAGENKPSIPVTPKMVTPRSLPKSTVTAPPPTGLPTSALAATPPANKAPQPSVEAGPAQAPKPVTAKPAVADDAKPAPQAPAAKVGEDKVGPPSQPTPDGHDLLSNHKFKTTSNHLVASYTDLEAISLEMDNRSPNTWLSLNSEGAIKAYKKQKDTVKDVNLNVGGHDAGGPKRTSPIVNITPNATASETISFLKIVAGRISTPPGRLIELAEHSNEEVRAAVAENTNLPNEAFLKLAKDSVSTVKLRLIDNSSCTTEVLGALQNDSDPYVAFEARNALKRLGAGLLKEREHNQFRGGHGHHPQSGM
ncbi:MAG: hypothetical protein JSS83_23620 [Cyanobacteria bacterium SZAS LIN-3]|nr:hypothetical protein [Cyanobacteria bacterium SZAS LIN-3]